MDSSINYFYQDYFCPTCNGYHDYTPCRMMQLDNRNVRAFSKQDSSDTEGWKISHTPSRVEGWSHVPCYQVVPPSSPPILAFYPNGAIVQPQSPERYHPTQITPVLYQPPPPQNNQNIMMEKQVTKINNQGEYKPTEQVEQEKTLQIRVASLNKGKLVWITIEPRETGASIAAKIYSIAGFQTRQVLSIWTASGRQIALDKKSFVFDRWEYISQFKHGEIWKVQWEPVKRNLFEKLLYKIIKV